MADEAVSSGNSELDSVEKVCGRFPSLQVADAELLLAMRGSTGVVVKDRKYHLRKYKQCFVAEDAVTWLGGFQQVSREESVATGQRLLDAGCIYHVAYDHHFKDGYLFFRFASSVVEAFPKSTKVAPRQDVQLIQRHMSSPNLAEQTLKISSKEKRRASRSSRSGTTLGAGDSNRGAPSHGEVPEPHPGEGLEKKINADEDPLPAQFRGPLGVGPLLELMGRMKAGDSAGGLEVKDRRYMMRKFKMCFIGSDAVTWIMGELKLPSRLQATAVGLEMHRRQWIRHVTNDHHFQDAELFFEFTVVTAEEATQNRHLLRIKIDKDDAKAVLGKGHFGEVLRGRYKGKTVAVKQIQDGANDKEFMKELDVMLITKSEHVIRLLGVCLLPSERGGGLGLVMEFAELGSLDRHLVNARDKLGPAALLQIGEDIAKGLAYLHSVNILHKDLATRNVLVSAEGTCKLADFGMSRVVGVDETYVTTSALPIRWSAPETLTEKQVTQASDCYMLGITLWELFSPGRLPYWQLRLSLFEIARQVVEGLRPQKPFSCSAKVFELMQRLWDGEVRARPSANDAAAELAQLSSDIQDGGAVHGPATYVSVLAAQEYQFGTSGETDDSGYDNSAIESVAPLNEEAGQQGLVKGAEKAEAAEYGSWKFPHTE